MTRWLPAVVVLGALLAGCGGGGDGGGSNSPKGTVEGFLSAVDDGDWKAACDHLYRSAGVDLSVFVHFSQLDFDASGALKDCPGALGQHADELRSGLDGTEPGDVKDETAETATVSSPKGDWNTAKVNGRWLVHFVPHG